MNREDALKASDDALKELADALRQGKSEKLVEYLGLMSRFHHYSFGNCILIAIQRPDATHVAGFGRWKDLGRFVRKGEKGISILAPLVGKRKKNETDESNQAENSTDEAQAGKVVFGFRVVHVFDVSQTEGQELPEFATLGGDPGEKFERLEVIIKSYGIALEYVESLPFNANGMSEGGKISINATRPKPQVFSTMVHELAHELLHWGDRRDATTKTIRETEAEAVAFVVCKSIGLETSTRASDYIQLWNGDEKVLLQSLEHIRTVAAKILSELNADTSSKEVADVA